MSCPLPGEFLFNATNNHVNIMAYKKLCNEFNVNVNSDFRLKKENRGKLETMYNYVTRTGYRPLTKTNYNPSRFQFIQHSTNRVIKIDYVLQKDAVDGWMQFLLDKSQGFTQVGAVRIDDIIRACVYCILNSQPKTRSNIIKSLECQQNFVDLLKSHINSLFLIPESIQKYQDAISNTGVRINYAVSIGLYMILSDLVLKVSVA